MDSRYFTRSRRLTDKVDLHRKLLNQSIVRRDFFAEITIGQDHLVERVTQHRPAFIEICALGDYLWPFDQLTHITLRKSRIFSGVATEHIVYLA